MIITINDAWQAGVDAVVLDNTLNKGGFADAVRTVISSNYSNAQATAWIDAVADELNRVAVITNPTYINMRADIIDDPVAHMELFDALSTIGQLPETLPGEQALELINLRAQRDEVNTSIATMLTFRPGQTEQVKEALNQGIENLRGYKEQLRQRIQQITGDPDS